MACEKTVRGIKRIRLCKMQHAKRQISSWHQKSSAMCAACQKTNSWHQKLSALCASCEKTTVSDIKSLRLRVQHAKKQLFLTSKAFGFLCSMWEEAGFDIAQTKMSYSQHVSCREIVQNQKKSRHAFGKAAENKKELARARWVVPRPSRTAKTAR